MFCSIYKEGGHITLEVGSRQSTEGPFQLPWVSDFWLGQSEVLSNFELLSSTYRMSVDHQETFSEHILCNMLSGITENLR